MSAPVLAVRFLHSHYGGTTAARAFVRCGGGRQRDGTEKQATNKAPALEANAPLTSAARALTCVYEMQMYLALKWFRHELSRETSPPLEQVVATGVTPLFVQFMESHPQLRVRMEAAWCLTNIASGDSRMIDAVVDAGSIPAAIQIMKAAPDCEQQDSAETIEDLRDQCTWLLSNLAGEGSHIRDIILASDGASALNRWVLELSSEVIPRQSVFLNNAAWACSNMVRGEVTAYTEEAAPLILQAILSILSKFRVGADASAVSDSLWCVCYIARISDVGLPVRNRSSCSTRAYAAPPRTCSPLPSPSLRNELFTCTRPLTGPFFMQLIMDAIVRRDGEGVPLADELIAHASSSKNKNIVPSLRTIGEFGAADTDKCAYIVERGALVRTQRLSCSVHASHAHTHACFAFPTHPHDCSPAFSDAH